MDSAVESESFLLTSLIVLLRLPSQCISDLSKQFNLGWPLHLPARCVCVLSLSALFQICNVFYKAWIACVKSMNNHQLLADQEPSKRAGFVSRLWNFAL